MNHFAQKRASAWLKAFGSALIIAFTLSVVGSTPSEASSRKQKIHAEWKPIETELVKNGFSSKFVRFLHKNFQTKRHDQVLRMNILSFLSVTDHHALVTDESVDASARFLSQNSASLKKAKELFGVDPEVVAALLWVETRHGNVRGDFHVPSVYLSLVSARSQKTQRLLLKQAKKTRSIASYDDEELREKIRSRSEKKSSWAIEELRSIEKIYNKNATEARQLKGSFAGAFGFPQFIPSSYLKWAYTDREGLPNLYDPHDAILSVAHYLKENGWGATEEERKKSLYAYNNSADYVDAILVLSEKLKARPQGG